MQEGIFEWDDNKRKTNIAKHGLDFVDGIEVFFDLNRKEWPDARKDYGEIRCRTIGMVNDVLLHVVYTKREEVTRIISVRRAHKNERKKYKEV